MLDIILDNANADDIFEICASLCGWQPYINNEVVVYDVTDEHPGGIIIGSNTDTEKDLVVHANILKTSRDWTIEKIRKPQDIHAVTERLESAVKTIEQWRDDEAASFKLATDLTIAGLPYTLSIPHYMPYCGCYR